MRLVLLMVMVAIVCACNNACNNDVLDRLEMILGTQAETVDVVGGILEGVDSLGIIPSFCYKSVNPHALKLILSKCYSYSDPNRRVVDIGKVICKNFLQIASSKKRSTSEFEIVRTCLEELATCNWNILTMYAHTPRDLRFLLFHHGSNSSLEACFPDLWKAFIANAMERVVIKAENGWLIAGYARQIEFLARFKEFTPSHFQRLLNGHLPLEYPSTIYVSWLDFTLSQRRVDLAVVAYQKGIKTWQKNRKIWPCHEEDVEGLKNRLALYETVERVKVVRAAILTGEGNFLMLPIDVLMIGITPLLYRLTLQNLDEEFSRNLLIFSLI